MRKGAKWRRYCFAAAIQGPDPRQEPAGVDNKERLVEIFSSSNKELPVWGVGGTQN